MIDFVFHSPTKIYFGHHAEDRLAEALKEFSFRRVLLVYGGGSIKKSGLYQKVLNQLDGASISHEELAARYAREMRMMQRLDPALAEAMGDQLFLAVFDTQEALDAFYRDALECV